MAGGNGRWPWRKTPFCHCPRPRHESRGFNRPGVGRQKYPCSALAQRFQAPVVREYVREYMHGLGARPVWPMSPRLPRSNGSASKRPVPCGRPCCYWIRICSPTTNGVWRCLATAPPGLPKHWPSNTTMRCFYSAPKALHGKPMACAASPRCRSAGPFTMPCTTGWPRTRTPPAPQPWSRAIGNSATSRLRRR